MNCALGAATRLNATIACMNEHFRYYLRVRYGECDAQKVVFNSRYSDYVDISTSEFLRALGFGEALADGSFDFQLVKQALEWKAPARFDQVLEISVYAKHLGNTSFTFATEFRIAGNERMIATAETVYVLVAPHSLTKMPLPAGLRSALQEGARGKVIDHAGYLADGKRQTTGSATN
jgi:acyl-CoA thioester hydrolase